jgi:hypothetical protein
MAGLSLDLLALPSKDATSNSSSKIIVNCQKIILKLEFNSFDNLSLKNTINKIQLNTS